jgi:hypothetical protein
MPIPAIHCVSWRQSMSAAPCFSTEMSSRIVDPVAEKPLKLSKTALTGAAKLPVPLIRYGTLPSSDTRTQVSVTSRKPSSTVSSLSPPTHSIVPPTAPEIPSGTRKGHTDVS